MRIGYDLDGVICKEPKWLSIFFKLHPMIGVYLRDKQPILCEPIVEGYIITGRPSCDREITLDWLWRNLIKYKALYMVPFFTWEKGIEYKVQMIEKLQLDVFVESDYRIIEELEKINSDCQYLLPRVAVSMGFLEKI